MTRLVHLAWPTKSAPAVGDVRGINDGGLRVAIVIVICLLLAGAAWTLVT